MNDLLLKHPQGCVIAGLLILMSTLGYINALLKERETTSKKTKEEKQ